MERATYEDAGAEGEGGLEAEARGVIAALAQAGGHPRSWAGAETLLVVKKRERLGEIAGGGLVLLVLLIARIAARGAKEQQQGSGGGRAEALVPSRAGQALMEDPITETSQLSVTQSKRRVLVRVRGKRWRPGCQVLS